VDESKYEAHMTAWAERAGKNPGANAETSP